ncbi:MAG: hypothetical protein ACK56I_36230, partial [bacterium]
IQGHGLCIKNETEYKSLCYDLYATFPKNSTFKCNYTRKKQLTAFLLETFLTYGAGHYYIEVYEMAVPKTLYWIFCYCLFIVLRVILKSNEEANTTGLIMTLLSFMFLIGMLAWQVTDMILY